MQVTEYLDSVSAHYRLSRHRPTFRSQRLAAEEHVHGQNVAKPELVIADGRTYMCVRPASCKVDFGALKNVLGANQVELADELAMANIFEDCELGAEPPFGSFYGLPTIMDERLADDEFIIFQSGSHEKAIKMDMAEYKRIEKPRICAFSYHMT